MVIKLISKIIDAVIIIAAIWASLFIAGKLKIKKNKGILSFFIFICLLLFASIIEIPVINCFANFKTPESAFAFSHTQEIADVVEGEESCMVFYKQDNNSYSQEYFLKIKDRYKITSSFSAKEIYNNCSKYGDYSVYNVKGTNDYYLIGFLTLTDENSLTVINSKNEEVKRIIETPAVADKFKEKYNINDKYVFLYDVIDEPLNNYYLIINGEKIVFS